jgi:hypothetical protein
MPATAAPLRLTEADVVRAVTDLMKAKGYRCMRLQSGVFASETRILRIGEKGLPDWLFLRAHPAAAAGWATVIFVECKAPGKKPRPEQAAWIAEATKAGLLATWTDDVKLFAAWLRERGL